MHGKKQQHMEGGKQAVLWVLSSDCDVAGKLQRLNAVLKDFAISALDLSCLLLFLHTH